MAIPQSGRKAQSESHFRFSTVPGFFLQDEEPTDPSTFDYVSGLVFYFSTSVPSMYSPGNSQPNSGGV